MRSKIREAWDIETTSLQLYGHGAAVPFAYTIFDGQNYKRKRLCTAGDRAELQDRLNRPTRKIFHNAKYDCSVLKHNGFTINGRIDDTMIMRQLLDNLRASDALAEQAYDLCGFDKGIDDRIHEIVKDTGDYSKVPDHIMAEYQRADALRGKALDGIYWPFYEADPILREIYEVEIELILTTIDMEAHGIKLLYDECAQLITWLDSEIDRMQRKTYDMFGFMVNPNSDKQVSHILFDKLKMPVLKLTDKTRQPKVDKDVIKELREDHSHPFLDLVQKYRSYVNGLSTIRKYIKLADLDNGIIHTNINTNFDKTGRQASSKPNLHNVAKERVELNPFPIPARRCFGPREGHVWDLYDESGIELRIIMERAQCRSIIDLWKQDPDYDVHTLLGKIWYAPDELTKIRRGAAKNCNFAHPYGAGPEKEAKTLGISLERVVDARRKIAQLYPEYFYFMKNVVRTIKEVGYITTSFGRKLKVPHGKFYIGPNYDVQGTAAEILKRAQVRVWKILKGLTGVKMILSIHDEIITEKEKRLTKAKQDEELYREIDRAMTDFPQISVPLRTERKRTSTRWADAA